MWSSRKLVRLERQARKRLDRFLRRARLLDQGLDDAGMPLDEHLLQVEIASTIINLQSFWSNWSRAYYLSACFGTVSISGVVINSALPIANIHDALTVA